MILAFSLSMPNNNSWNGKWSGEGRPYVITKSFLGKRKDIAQKILQEGHYHYSFGDGWAARISVDEVDPNTAKKLRAKSCGFCGYEWMVDTIIKYGRPMNSQDVEKYRVSND